MPKLVLTPNLQRLIFAAIALVPLPAVAQTLESVSLTRAELTQRLLYPNQRSEYAAAPTPKGNREAPSFGALYAAGIGGGAAGGLVLGGVGALIDGDAGSDGAMLPSGKLVLGYTGAAIGVPVGVHLANGRRGRLWAGILTSLAGDLVTGAVVGYTEPGNRNAEIALASLFTAGKIAAVVAVERASERW